MESNKDCKEISRSNIVDFLTRDESSAANCNTFLESIDVNSNFVHNYSEFSNFFNTTKSKHSNFLRNQVDI